MIRTKWHLMKELYKDDLAWMTNHGEKFSLHTSEVPFIHANFTKVLNECDTYPKFVFDSELLALAHESEFYQSLIDMKKAGVLHLPYSRMVVEYKSKDSNTTIICVFYEPPENLKGNPDVSGMAISIHKDDDGEYIAIPWSIADITLVNRNDTPTLRFEAEIPTWLDFSDEIAKQAKGSYLKDGKTLAVGWFLVMLILQTRGIVREPIEVSKINKVRVKSGKTIIPMHTFIKIGHVYNKDGDKVVYDNRKSPRPHWRRGHIRNVRYGKGRSEKRPVFIAPMLVNYKGDGVFKDPDYIIT